MDQPGPWTFHANHLVGLGGDGGKVGIHHPHWLTVDQPELVQPVGRVFLQEGTRQRIEQLGHSAPRAGKGDGGWKRGRSYFLILAASPFLLVPVSAPGVPRLPARLASAGCLDNWFGGPGGSTEGGEEQLEELLLVGITRKFS